MTIFKLIPSIYVGTEDEDGILFEDKNGNPEGTINWTF